MGLSLTKKFPGTKGVRWFNVAVLVITPLTALYGLYATNIRRSTGIFAGIYYIFSMLGENALTIMTYQAQDNL
jgi:stearoyl-CoA desaturase (delta-9 desaturase)